METQRDPRRITVDDKKGRPGSTFVWLGGNKDGNVPGPCDIGIEFLVEGLAPLQKSIRPWTFRVLGIPPPTPDNHITSRPYVVDSLHSIQILLYDLLHHSINGGRPAGVRSIALPTPRPHRREVGCYRWDPQVEPPLTSYLKKLTTISST
jgi:hypothetical protein